MTEWNKEDFLAALDCIREAIELDHVIAEEERIEYDPALDPSGQTVLRHIAKRWTHKVTVRVAVGMGFKNLEIELGQDL